MSNEDYYRVLGVSSDATTDEIKRAFRKRALETHPDRNPDKQGAEENFKKLSEAYGVLSDPEKRSQYDQYRRYGFNQRSGAQGQPGFGYSQEEIFRDFFSNRASQDVFSEMQREFAKMGFRFDEQFINNLFFGGRTYVFRGNFQGRPGRVHVFRQGNFGPRAAGKSGGSSYATPQKPPSLAKPLLKMGASLVLQAGKKLGKYLVNKVLTLTHAPENGKLSDGRQADVTYQLAISPRDAYSGATVDVRLPHMNSGKIVSVKIPPGVHNGTKLRLRNMGRPSAGAQPHRGDVYIQLQVMDG